MSIAPTVLVLVLFNPLLPVETIEMWQLNIFSPCEQERLHSCVTLLRLVAAVLKTAGADVEGGVLGSLEGLYSNG